MARSGAIRKGGDMKRSSYAAIVVMAMSLVLAAIAPAHAISNGTLDGNTHPAVACVVGIDADGTQVGCATGQLISPTVVLVAAHEAAGFAELPQLYVSFDPDFHLATSKLYPVVASIPHPDWSPQTTHQFTNEEDIGVMLLSQPVEGVTPIELPPVGLVDQLKVGQRVGQVTAVGYGCGTPDGIVRLCDDLRRQAPETVAAIQPNTVELQMNTPGRNGPTGVCSGDSGGPILLPGTNTTIGVESSARAG